ncbi:S41 family peptidase [Bacteroidales bacterium OttesenSCG-928-C03]|nr:S41 family peptidase [Bacteroidales bacterium OttesenSCG-928-C03]MDL2325883.1 S41 family peptidase [Bacteroidales bacterium OttesenSCG-928-A14]
MEYIDDINYTNNEQPPRKRNWLPLYLAIAFLAGIWLANTFIPSASKNSTTQQTDKFNEIMRYINLYYIDTVNNDALFETAMNSMLHSLDPHSSYSNPEEQKALQEQLDGAFEGIGVQFNIVNDTVIVVAVISGGPSEKAGLRTGDRMVTVDGKDFTGVDNTAVFKTLRGKRNSVVNIGILRDGFSQIYDYEITRDVIPTYTVDVSYMVDEKTGYVKINQFGSTTAKEFSQALRKLNGEGMQQLIVDLRGNHGGYLDACIDICDELLAGGELIVYTEGLNSKPVKFFATNKGQFEEGNLVILIDEFSASASEIVAGAVQDQDRGWIVGRRSFGKGLVQRQFDLRDRSSVRLTVSRYHTPSGRSIQKEYKNGMDAYSEDLLLRYENGEMDSDTNIVFDESLAYKTKKGRTVYGGGGIMPDYFVPVDHDTNLTAFYQVLNSSALTEFALQYSTQHQDDLRETYKSAKEYVRKMVITDETYRSLIRYHNTQNPGAKLAVSRASEKELRLWLKALIGRNIFQEEAFFPVINTTDKGVMRAMELLR